MAKILPNRSSKTLTPANIEAIKTAVQTIIDNLGEASVITDADFSALAKLGDVLKPICDQVLEVAEEFPNYLEEEQPLAEVHKDKTLHEQYEEIRKQIKRVTFKLDREQGICGAEYRNAITNYESNVKGRVKKGSTNAQMVLDKLNRIDRNTNTAAPTTNSSFPQPVK